MPFFFLISRHSGLDSLFFFTIFRFPFLYTLYLMSDHKLSYTSNCTNQRLVLIKRASRKNFLYSARKTTESYVRVICLIHSYTDNENDFT